MKNQVQLIGNVGQAPEIKILDNGRKLAKFSLATNETYRAASGEKVQQTQWHRLVAWGRTADIVKNYVSRGRRIAVQGKLNNRSYTDAAGQTHYVTEVVVDEVILLDSRKEEMSTAQN